MRQLLLSVRDRSSVIPNNHCSAKFTNKKSFTEDTISTIDITSHINESMVSFVSRRYMRGENGKDSLMVCLSRIAIFVCKNNVI